MRVALRFGLCLCLAGCVANRDGGKPHAADLAIHAEQLFSHFASARHDIANPTYAGRWLAVTGTVKTVQPGRVCFEPPFIDNRRLARSDTGWLVECVFETESATGTIRPGAEITVVGRCEYQPNATYNLILRHCRKR
jgi:hypothetical protein